MERKELKSINNSLTDADSASINLTEPASASGDFVDGQAKDVTATITVGTGNDAKTTTVSLMVTMKTTAQENAENLAKEIQTDIPSTSTVYLSDQDVGANLSTANPTTGALINRTLQTRSNNNLTFNEVSNITYTGNLAAKQATAIHGSIPWEDSNGTKGTVTFTVKVFFSRYF